MVITDPKIVTDSKSVINSVTPASAGSSSGTSEGLSKTINTLRDPTSRAAINKVLNMVSENPQITGEDKDLQKLNEAFKRAMSIYRLEPDGDIPMDGSVEELTEYFSKTIASACSANSSFLSADVQLIRTTLVEIQAVNRSMSQAVDDVKSYVHNGTAGPTMNKAVLTPVPTPITSNKGKMIRGLMNFGAFYNNTLGYSLKDVLEQVPEPHRANMLEACDGSKTDKESMTAIFYEYAEKN